MRSSEHCCPWFPQRPAHCRRHQWNSPQLGEKGGRPGQHEDHHPGPSPAPPHPTVAAPLPPHRAYPIGASHSDGAPPQVPPALLLPRPLPYSSLLHSFLGLLSLAGISRHWRTNVEGERLLVPTRPSYTSWSIDQGQHRGWALPRTYRCSRLPLHLRPTWRQRETCERSSFLSVAESTASTPPSRPQAELVFLPLSPHCQPSPNLVAK